MTDKMTPEQRHRCMSHVRSKNTKPEMLVRRFLFSRGFRYRVNVKNLPGKPDIVLRKYRTVIFVNGCFWHGHEGCDSYSFPKSHIEFWRNKIERNRQRDQAETKALRSMGWHVIRIWECELKPKVRTTTLESLVYTLNHILLINYGQKVSIKKYEEYIPEVSVAAEAQTSFLKSGKKGVDE